MDSIKGEVFVIKNPRDYYKINSKKIIVTKNTHPDITLIIKKVIAIITEVDNKLCHAAIIAREYRKPLLMGIEDATKKFKNGDIMRIDFINKKISIIK